MVWVYGGAFVMGGITHGCGAIGGADRSCFREEAGVEGQDAAALNALHALPGDQRR